MKNPPRRNFVGISLLALALGVTSFQAVSLAGGSGAKAKPAARTWNLQNAQEVRIIHRDPVFQLTTGGKKVEMPGRPYYVGVVHILLYGQGIEFAVTRFRCGDIEIVRNYNRAKNSHQDVVFVLSDSSRRPGPVYRSELTGSLRGKKVEDFIDLYENGKLTMVIREAKTRRIIRTESLAYNPTALPPLPEGTGITNSGGFEIKPTPTPPHLP